MIDHLPLAMTIAAAIAGTLGGGWLVFRGVRLGRRAQEMLRRPTTPLAAAGEGMVEAQVTVDDFNTAPSSGTGLPCVWCRYGMASDPESGGDGEPFDSGGHGRLIRVHDASGTGWIDAARAEMQIPEELTRRDGTKIRERRIAAGDRLYVVGPVSRRPIKLPGAAEDAEAPVEPFFSEGPAGPLVVRPGDEAAALVPVRNARRAALVLGSAAAACGVAATLLLVWLYTG